MTTFNHRTLIIKGILLCVLLLCTHNSAAEQAIEITLTKTLNTNFDSSDTVSMSDNPDHTTTTPPQPNDIHAFVLNKTVFVVSNNQTQNYVSIVSSTGTSINKSFTDSCTINIPNAGAYFICIFAGEYTYEGIFTIKDEKSAEQAVINYRPDLEFIAIELLNNITPAEIDIFDIYGNLVYKQISHNQITWIDTSTLPLRTYIIGIYQNKNKIASQKIVIR